MASTGAIPPRTAPAAKRRSLTSSASSAPASPPSTPPTSTGRLRHWWGSTCGSTQGCRMTCRCGPHTCCAAWMARRGGGAGLFHQGRSGSNVWSLTEGADPKMAKLRDDHCSGGPDFGKRGRELRLGGPVCGRGPSAGPTLAHCRSPACSPCQGLTGLFRRAPTGGGPPQADPEAARLRVAPHLGLTRRLQDCVWTPHLGLTPRLQDGAWPHA
mmetsp:Transcript_29881/g.88431  ORF Transcript_29881/g.88431 Transcript_29881/m.88431 type:complete len:213 (+) Transcript_29881:471-1109(+)|eukprot:267807-Chlamydomonas_euryale.AAC.1